MLSFMYTPDGLQQFQNLGRANAAGVEMELSGKFAGGSEMLASFAFQRVVTDDRSVLPNSPGQIGKFRYSVPLLSDRASVSFGLQYMGERRTGAGAVLPWLVNPEIAVNTPKLLRSFEFTVAVRNLANQHQY